MSQEPYYLICMEAKSGKELYLKADEEAPTFSWNFDKNVAIWFDTEADAEKFGNDYFKNFDDWKVVPS